MMCNGEHSWACLCLVKYTCSIVGNALRLEGGSVDSCTLHLCAAKEMVSKFKVYHNTAPLLLMHYSFQSLSIAPKVETKFCDSSLRPRIV